MTKKSETLRLDIADGIYEFLRASADRNKRSISAEFEAIILEHCGLPVERGNIRVQFILDGDKYKKIPARMASA